MNILTILGSPRRRGNTAGVLTRFEKLAGARHAVERINLADYTVHGCLGCSRCQKHLDEPGCGQKDDGVAILSRIIAADAVVYATPLYCWSYSAQMKALIDRHFCLVKWKDGQVASALMSGRLGALLVTCGDPPENNADLIQIEFARQMEYLRGRCAGSFIVANCTTPKALGAEADWTAAEALRALEGVQP